MPSGKHSIHLQAFHGNYWQRRLKSPANNIKPPKMLLFRRRSFSVKLSASKCAVRPPSRRVAAIPDDANAKAMSHLDRIVAKIKMTNVFPVPPATAHYFERIPAMYQHCIAALDLILG
ncbi:hypothetical protein EVAR_87216_1 [Eumeta japonica]|uniref:Uncharacterized protein n=1 Tax=Eumeta variegata TaxID=151549 RepID=A0A4C1VXX2_EUMVA|nr:hypothetical protein EVAR_87216_1 [Eumeta japonica]